MRTPAHALAGCGLRSDRAAAPVAAPPEGVAPLLQVRGLVKHFPVHGKGTWRRAGTVHAVCDVSFDLYPGQTLGLVGESGSGKSTTARCLVRLEEPTAGSINLAGEDVLRARPAAMRRLRRMLQIVFQDPYGSLDPRMTVGASLAEPLKVHHQAGNVRERVGDLLELVGLEPEHRNRYPHEFSGGQRQRIGIARALALEPKVVILDEPVSALDVSIQAGVLNLLEELQDRLGIAFLFIAHDLSVVRHLCDQVAVMYLGRLVETGSRDDIFRRPAHPYTQAVMSAVPIPDPARERQRRRIILAGDIPSPSDPPSGCRFRTRCWKAREVCAAEVPALTDRGQGHPVACHFPELGQPS